MPWSPWPAGAGSRVSGAPHPRLPSAHAPLLPPLSTCPSRALHGDSSADQSPHRMFSHTRCRSVCLPLAGAGQRISKRRTAPYSLPPGRASHPPHGAGERCRPPVTHPAPCLRPRAALDPPASRGHGGVSWRPRAGPRSATGPIPPTRPVRSPRWLSEHRSAENAGETA